MPYKLLLAIAAGIAIALAGCGGGGSQKPQKPTSSARKTTSHAHEIWEYKSIDEDYVMYHDDEDTKASEEISGVNIFPNRLNGLIIADDCIILKKLNSVSPMKKLVGGQSFNRVHFPNKDRSASGTVTKPTVHILTTADRYEVQSGDILCRDSVYRKGGYPEGWVPPLKPFFYKRAFQIRENEFLLLTDSIYETQTRKNAFTLTAHYENWEDTDRPKMAWEVLNVASALGFSHGYSFATIGSTGTGNVHRTKEETTGRTTTSGGSSGQEMIIGGITFNFGQSTGTSTTTTSTSGGDQSFSQSFDVIFYNTPPAQQEYIDIGIILDNLSSTSYNATIYIPEKPIKRMDVCPHGGHRYSMTPEGYIKQGDDGRDRKWRRGWVEARKFTEDHCAHN